MKFTNPAAAAAVPLRARSTGNVPTNNTCGPKMQKPMRKRMITLGTRPQ
jgi:hypothetical protein